MWSFASFCDDFYVNSRLFLKLDLDPSRETLLHFFDRIRQVFPQMTRLRRRDDGGLMLDEPASEHARRYLRLDPQVLRFGIFAPPNVDAVDRLADTIFTQAPAHLGLSDLDFDYLEVVYAFDLEFAGNHDELVADALLADQPLLKALAADGQRVIECQPYFGIALTSDCDTQAYVEIKSRSSTFEVRSGDFEASALSVYLTVRRYWGVSLARELAGVHRELVRQGEQIAAQRIVPLVVQPLAEAIASRR